MRRTVAHVVADFALAGAERVATSLLLHADRQRFRPVAVALHGAMGSGLERSLAEAEVPVRFLGKGLGFSPWTLFGLDRALGQLGAEVVHTHGRPLLYALPGAVRRRLPLVHTVHAEAEVEVGRRAPWVHPLGRRLGMTTVAISEGVAESLAVAYGPHPVEVVRNGIEVDRFDGATPGDWRIRLRVPDDEPLVVAVGRLVHLQGHDLLLEAVARLGRPVTVAIAGEGPERDALTRRIERLGLAARVHLLGHVEDVPGLLAAADVACHPSRSEGLGLAVMEAQAAGCPVLATRVGGVPEVVEPGQTGLLVASEDVSELTRALEILLGDTGFRARLSQAARAHAREHFGAVAMTRAYEALYDRVLR